LLIKIWNARAEDLWGLHPDEVIGNNLLNLDIGLPLEEIRPAIRACLSGESTGRELTVDATSRRGKAIRCRVACKPMTTGGFVGGVILVMDEDGPSPA
jgi:two-component system CheB/CheR fusion protein